MSSRRVAWLGAALGSVVATSVGAEPLRIEYTLTWGSIAIGRIEVAAEHADGRYRLQSRARTMGILGFFAPLESTTVTEGATAADGRALPSSFHVESRWRDQERRLRLTLDPSGKVLADERVEPEPPADFRLEPVPESLRRGPDPLAQVFTAVMQAAPERTLAGRAYDGRRVVDATLACGAIETKPTPAAALAGGPVFPCTLESKLVAGGRAADPDAKPVVQGPARLWLAKGGGTLGAWPVRMELDTRYGMVVAEPDRPPTRAATAEPGQGARPPG